MLEGVEVGEGEGLGGDVQQGGNDEGLAAKHVGSRRAELSDIRQGREGELVVEASSDARRGSSRCDCSRARSPLRKGGSPHEVADEGAEEEAEVLREGGDVHADPFREVVDNPGEDERAEVVRPSAERNQGALLQLDGEACELSSELQDGGDDLEVEDVGQGEAEIIGAGTSDAEFAKVQQLAEHDEEGVEGEQEAVAREGAALDDTAEDEEEGEDHGACEAIGSDLRVDADDEVTKAWGEALHLEDEEEPLVDDRGEGGAEVGEEHDGHREQVVHGEAAGASVEVHDVVDEVPPVDEAVLLSGSKLGDRVPDEEVSGARDALDVGVLEAEGSCRRGGANDASLVVVLGAFGDEDEEGVVEVAGHEEASAEPDSNFVK